METETDQPAAKPGIMQRLFGNLGDPHVRRDRQAKTKEELERLEADALAVQAALDAGATEASLYEPGKVPEIGGQVIYRGGPATILKVITPGDPMTPLDLVGYQNGAPLAFAGVEHDRILGWHWLAEPSPPEPQPEDRVRAARAAGLKIPEPGTEVAYLVAMPRSYRGLVLQPLRAKVVGVVDVDLGAPNPNYAPLDPQLEALGYRPAEPLLPSTIWVALAVDVEQPDAIESEWPAHLRANDLVGLRLERVAGPLEPHSRVEGWAYLPRRVITISPDAHGIADRPCDRCGSETPMHKSVTLASHDNARREKHVFAKLCGRCADAIGRLALMPPDAPSREEAS